MTKKALLIGINYKGTDNELHGCINDIDNVKSILLQQNFKEDDITILTDDTLVKPTYDNIVSSFQKLISSNASVLYFHYSGHGTLVVDQCNTQKEREERCEASGYDSAIVPLDFNDNGFIDEDLFRSLINPLSHSSTLIGVLDACHSGTGFDLLYNVRSVGKSFELVMDKLHKETNAFVVLLSGCADDQTSADAYINKEAQGALTYYYLSVLKQNNYDLAYDTLLSQIREQLKNGGYNQRPQLSFGKHINLHQDFHL